MDDVFVAAFSVIVLIIGISLYLGTTTFVKKERECLMQFWENSPEYYQCMYKDK